MIVLGVDPGTATTGYGVVRAIRPGEAALVECGVIRTKARDPLASRLKEMLTERDRPVVPGIPRGPRARLVHWVEPAVVVDVRFTMVTSDGVLRQPVFRGIRDDKGVDEARG